MKWLDEKICILPKKDTKLSGWTPGPSELNDKAAAHLAVLLGLEHWFWKTSSHILKCKYVSYYFDFSGTIPSLKLSRGLTALLNQDLTQWTCCLYHNEPLKLCKIFLKNLTLIFSDYQTQSSIQTWVCYPAGGCRRMDWGIYFYAVLH